jgi:hypothetical protein
MIIRAEQIGERVKYWVRPDIENRIREGSIKAYFNSNVTKITPHTITITTPHGLVTIDNDWVIAMSGYVPDTSFLQSCGIRLTDNATRKPEYNPDTFETNVPVLFIAGVVCGGLDTHTYFIENSENTLLQSCIPSKIKINNFMFRACPRFLGAGSGYPLYSFYRQSCRFYPSRTLRHQASLFPLDSRKKKSGIYRTIKQK